MFPRACDILFEGFNSITATETTRLSRFNDFSVSLYDDGSIRFRYHSIQTPKNEWTYQNFAGLWGSQVSSAVTSSPASLRYHMENLTEILGTIPSSGQDIVFCYLPQVFIRHKCYFLLTLKSFIYFSLMHKIFLEDF